MIRPMMWGAIFASLALSAQAVPVGVTVESKHATVYAAPDVASEIVGTASAGQVYAAVERAGVWVRVDFSGAGGWVVSTDLADSGAAASVTLTRPAAVRSGPGTAFTVLGEAAKGRTFAVVGLAEGYAEVTFAGGTGFIAGGNFDADGDGAPGDVAAAGLGGSLADLVGALPANARLFHLGPFPDTPIFGGIDPDRLNSDLDQDGVVGDLATQMGPDQCPNTPAGVAVDSRGCPLPPTAPQYSVAGNSAATYVPAVAGPDGGSNKGNSCSAASPAGGSPAGALMAAAVVALGILRRSRRLA